MHESCSLRTISGRLMLLATILAVWWWKERLQRRGWVGLALAAAALALLNA